MSNNNLISLTDNIINLFPKETNILYEDIGDPSSYLSHDIKKLEDLICKYYYGEGLLRNYKPNINKILSFSRERIANNFLCKIKKIKSFVFSPIKLKIRVWFWFAVILYFPSKSV